MDDLLHAGMHAGEVRFGAAVEQQHSRFSRWPLAIARVSIWRLIFQRTLFFNRKALR
jgi:hypothetical protein